MAPYSILPVQGDPRMQLAAEELSVVKKDSRDGIRIDRQDAIHLSGLDRTLWHAAEWRLPSRSRSFDRIHHHAE
jgi:hypothetical protein